MSAALMRPPIPPADQAARIRAAVGFSGETYTEIAKVLKIHPGRFRDRYTATNPKGAHSMDELYAIAKACGVPPAFLEEGFARYEVEPAEDGQLHARVDQLGRTVAEQASQLADLHKAIDELSPERSTEPNADAARQAAPDPRMPKRPTQSPKTETVDEDQTPQEGAG